MPEGDLLSNPKIVTSFRRKLPRRSVSNTVSSHTSTTRTANSSSGNKQNCPPSNVNYFIHTTPRDCTSSKNRNSGDNSMSQFTKTAMRSPVKTAEPSSILVTRSSPKAVSVNGDTMDVKPPININGSAKSELKTKVNIDGNVIVVNTNCSKKFSPPKSNIESKPSIVPPDKVESVLETMFQCDNNATSISSQQSESQLHLNDESVENILKSPLAAERTPDKIFNNASRDNSTSSNITRVKNNNLNNKLQTSPSKKTENSLTTNGNSPSLKSPIGVNSQKCDIELSKNSDKSTDKVTTKNVSDDGPYVQVESELAKMFAGIDNSKAANASNSLPNNSNNSFSEPCASSSGETPSRTPADSHEAASAASSVPLPKKPPRKRNKKSNQRKASTSVKNSKTKQSSGKENSAVDSVISKRVPVIHIEGSKENPISVQIINSIRTEEDDVNDNKAAAKRKAGKCDRPVKRLATDYVLKNYDPTSSDSSWVCIFCKLCAYNAGLSGESLGDLFGPYFIKDPNKAESQAYSQQTRPLPLGSDQTDSSIAKDKSLEIWAHEHCFVWASGVHLIGSKLIGLEEAVWDALKTKCGHCGENGANIGCRTRHCRSFMHYGCAIFNGWKLDAEKFLSTCKVHSVAK